MEAAGIRTSTPESGDIEQLRESSGGCGLLLELEESGRLEHAPEVERVLQLCAQVAAIHTQKEFLDAYNPPKGCPGCFWVFFAVCLEQHPDLSDVIARVIENLLHDRRRNIITLVMAPMRLIRAAWSREGDARCYPFMGNCLDFQTEVDGIGMLRHGKLFFGSDYGGDRSFSQRAGNIMLSREVRVAPCVWMNARRTKLLTRSAATCVSTLRGHISFVNSVAFHPSAPYLATGSGDKTAKLWLLNADCSAATCVSTLQGHSSFVFSVAFHPSAPYLATGSSDTTAKLWR